MSAQLADPWRHLTPEAPVPSGSAAAERTVWPRTAACLWLAGSGIALGEGDSRCVIPKPAAPDGATHIILHTGPGLDARVVTAAIEMWRRCPGYGHRFPSFASSGPGDRHIFVRQGVPRQSPACGSYHGRLILLRRAAWIQGKPGRCGSQVQNLAHEIGHALGLAHPPSLPGCRRSIMADVDPSNAFKRRVTPAECRAVSGRWRLERRRLGAPRPGTYAAQVRN